MAEDNALDDFLTGSTSQGLANNDTGQAIQQAPLRPKLKKIKRAKIRPALDFPSAPEKVVSDQDNVSEIKESQPLVSEDISDEKTLSEEINVNANPQVEETLPQTSLVTAATAQNITTENVENSYILDELPPELDYAMDENTEDEYLDTSNYVKKSAVYIVAFIFLFIGLFVGKTFFSEKKIENLGLEGIVTNPDVPSGRPRCGLTDKNQACIFYVLNWYKQELNGRDFYKLAAQLTGREEYMIESENMHYANVKIKPGHFAQLNIPALK